MTQFELAGKLKDACLFEDVLKLLDAVVVEERERIVKIVRKYHIPESQTGIQMEIDAKNRVVAGILREIG